MLLIISYTRAFNFFQWAQWARSWHSHYGVRRNCRLSSKIEHFEMISVYLVFLQLGIMMLTIIPTEFFYISILQN